MKICLMIVVAAALAGNSWALDRCSVVRAIRRGGLAGIKGYSLGDFVCLAYHASRYDTSLHRSPTEYGIFQINSYWWCDDGKTPGRKNWCRMPCTDLLDTDIEDDVRCVKRIVSDPNGLEAWEPWKEYCRGQALSSFVEECPTGSAESSSCFPFFSLCPGLLMPSLALVKLSL
uniref:Lysozyme C n=1 Tax=Xenopus tropicalis TaxID=8364 RepID=A0A6I8QPB1_XENTR